MISSRVVKMGAITLVSAATLSACVMPGSDEARQQSMKSSQTKTADKNGDKNTDSSGEAAETSAPASLTSVKVKDQGNSTVVLNSDYVILSRAGDGNWSVVAQNVDPTLYRYGAGRGTTMPLSSFIQTANQPNGLRMGYQIVNAIITGKNEAGATVSYLAAVQQPESAERGASVRFAATPATTGNISKGMMEAANGVTDKAGYAYMNSLPGGNQVNKVLLSDAAIYFDNGASKTIGRCVMLPGTVCVRKDGDLYRSDLTGLNLAGSNFSGSNLSSSTARKTIFDGSNLSKAQLFRIDASNSSWNKVNLSSANAHQITLTNSVFTSVNASHADLFRAELDNVKANGSNFTKAMLQQITIRKATATNTDFTGSNLFRAEMSDTDFTKSKFGNANMAQVIAQRSRFTGVSAPQADMSSIDVRGADMSNADLKGVQFAHATLKGTNFNGADLTGAILFGADINGANFNGAKISGMTCPNGEIIGKTYLKKKYYNSYWKRYMGQDKKLKMCRPVYKEVKNTTAENSGVDTSG